MRDSMTSRSVSLIVGSVMAGVSTIEVSGWSTGPTVSHRIRPEPTSRRSSKPRTPVEKAKDSSASTWGRKLALIEIFMSAIVDCCGGWDFSIPDRSQRVLDQNRRQAVLSGDDAVTVGPRRDAHEFAEAGAEGAQRGEADGEA